MSSRLPLEGIVVVEIGHSVSAPYAGLVLGQLGAEVYKIETPWGGDHARSWGQPLEDNSTPLFQAMNRGKHSVALDLRDAQARERLRRFIATRADVVIQNLRAHSIDELGLGAADLASSKPSLIYCNLSAFGGIGPMGAKPGYDPLMQAYGGLMSVTGEEDGQPVRIGVSVVDIGTGMWSVIGILAALIERARSGKGAIVDTSLYETALAWMGMHITEYSANRVDPQRHGSGAPQIVPYQTFDTADGQLMVAAGNDSLFHKLCMLLGHPEWSEDERLSTNPARVNNRTLMVTLLQDVLGQQSTQYWRQRLDAGGVPNAPLQTVSQVIADEQTAALEILQDMHEAGLTAVGLPLRFDGARPAQQMRAPRLGEHTALVTEVA